MKIIVCTGETMINLKTWQSALATAILSLVFILSSDSALAGELSRGPGHLVYLDQSIEYDSNVIGNVDEASLDEGDLAFGSTAMLELSVMPEPEKDLDLRLSYLFLQYLYGDTSENDLRHHAPSTILWWRTSPELAATVKAGYVFSEEDDKDFYEGLFGEALVQYLLADESKIEAGYRISQEDYDLVKHEGRDSLEHRIELKWKGDGFLEKSNSTILGRGEIADADNDGYSYVGAEAKGSLGLKDTPGQFDWDFSLGYRFREYDAIYPGFTEDRTDHRITAGGRVSHPIYRDIISISLELNYMHNSSDLGTFDYDRVNLSTHISAIF